MNVQYSWYFPPPIVIPEYNGYTDVVQTVYYVYTGLDTVSGYGASVTGTVVLDLNSITPDNYVSFNNLTPDKVIEWVTASVSLTDLQTQVNEKIEALINPPVNKPFPFYPQKNEN